MNNWPLNLSTELGLAESTLARYPTALSAIPTDGTARSPWHSFTAAKEKLHLEQLSGATNKDTEPINRHQLNGKS